MVGDGSDEDETTGAPSTQRTGPNRASSWSSGPMAVFLPCACVCFIIFGVTPMISQLINKLECDRLGSSDCDDPSVNGAAVLTMKYLEIVQYSCATLTLGTLGGVSDYMGRRLIMALSLGGQIVQVVLVLVTVLVPGVMSYWTALYFIYVGTAITGLTGSYGTFLMGVYAYGADTTKDSPGHRSRTFARYTGAVAIGNTLGPLINGVLLDRYDDFRVPLVLLLVSGLLILVLLAATRESLDPADRPPGSFDPLRRHNTLAIFYRFLVMRQVEERSKQQPQRSGRRREGPGPPSLLALSAVFCLCFSDLVGQGTIFLYYARRVFHWRPAWLGFYESSVGFSKGIVLLVIMPIAYRCLKGRPPNDYVVCLVGMLFNMGYFLVLALLPYPQAAVAAVPLTGLGQMTYPHLRSLFSLAVPGDVQGQLFSLISALETLATTLTPIVVNTVYNHTVTTFPGMVWLVMAGYLVLAMLALYVAWRSANSSGGGGLGVTLTRRCGDGEGVGGGTDLDCSSSHHDSNEARRQLLGFQETEEEGLEGLALSPADIDAVVPQVGGKAAGTNSRS